ncbi:MAG TPA: carboxypeptidase regulatory-like domain-containing protein [Casimicrobiaceae bacterium]
MFDRQLHSFLLAAITVFGAASVMLAQDGVVRGRVTDSAGVAIQDADVSIIEVHALTRTNAQGQFTLSKVPPGEHEVSVRRLGYRPTMIKAIVGDMAYSYDIVMPVQAAVLNGVDVSAEDMRLRLGIEDFYRRRARGAGGLFFTRAEIAQRGARRTTDILNNSAGLSVVNGRGGSGLRFTGKRQCTPSIWLDGQEVRNMEVDNIPVTDIEGMEIYSGPSTTPMQFSHETSRTDCGAVVIWTRIPGTP